MFINHPFFTPDNWLNLPWAISHWQINGYGILTMFWNLLLIVIPALLAIALAALCRRSKFKTYWSMLGGWLLFLLWLLFIPNTAYVITDVRHLISYCPADSEFRVCAAGAWMIPVFFTYGLLGWLALVYLINQFKDVVKVVLKSKWAAIFPLAMMPLITLGVLLGLLNRFNSWEFFLNPSQILVTAGTYFSSWAYFFNFLIFWLFFSMLYLLGDYVLRPLPWLKLKTKVRQISYGLPKSRKGRRPVRK